MSKTKLQQIMKTPAFATITYLRLKHMTQHYCVQSFFRKPFNDLCLERVSGFGLPPKPLSAIKYVPLATLLCQLRESRERQTFHCVIKHLLNLHWFPVISLMFGMDFANSAHCSCSLILVCYRSKKTDIISGSKAKFLKLLHCLKS